MSQDQHAAPHGDGGPAFPLATSGLNVPNEANGMSMRDYFAAAIAQGLVTATEPDGQWNHDPSTVADTAYRYADAMLKARGT